MKDQKEPISPEHFVYIMRIKLDWLLGFSAAIQNKDLERFVTDARMLFNRTYGKQEVPAEQDAELGRLREQRNKLAQLCGCLEPGEDGKPACNPPCVACAIMNESKSFPVRKTKCETCPFRPGGPYSQIAGDLAKSALSEGSRICHSTGRGGIMGRTGVRSHYCRGARDVQLKALAAIGFLAAATDEAWNIARRLIGKRPQITCDPH